MPGKIPLALSRCVVAPAILCVALAVWPASKVLAQDDPASDTKIIQETLDKIKDVGNLDRYIAENAELKAVNKALGEQVAALTKQVAKLTQELQVENERLRKQLVELPNFEVKSRLIVPARGMAVLQFGEKTVRIREGITMSVPVSDGIWVLMDVVKISTDVIELRFPELERDIVIYD